MTVLLAELLAGLVIGRPAEEGAPMLLGMLPVYFDMKTLMNFYDARRASWSLGLCRNDGVLWYSFIAVPCRAAGTGWGMDLLTAETYWMNTLMFTLTKGGIVPFVGDTLGCRKTMSPQTFIYAHEIIDQALRFSSGFQLDDTQVGLDEIHKVEAGKSYVSCADDAKKYRTGFYANRSSHAEHGKVD